MDAYGNLPFPWTALTLDAVRFARDLEEPAIFNHSMRAYLYGRFLGDRQGLRPGHDYDDELLLLGCVLHDAGLTEPGNGEQRFDLDGADLAAEFLTGQGVAPERVEIVWDAIALHLCPEIAARKRPEIALVMAGSGYDLGPEGPALPPGYADAIHAVLPRLHAAAVLHDAIVGQALAKPRKAPPYSMPGELVRQVTGQVWPTWRELMEASGWDDYDGYRR
ncbi:HD domain-containing protein [Nonomuraea sp. SBT364]|uniref:HD domain-containing protein n=1 Tax=Nonomuraea sp. SBT364 TaxID=1580530 RepID=UPI00066CC673|nr:HD domain-containing protein [Nonomuraea sp. SBT364]